MSALKFFENTIVKNRSFSRGVELAAYSGQDFLGGLEQLALKAYPSESQDIRDHLVLRGFMEGIRHSQARSDLRKQIGDMDVNIETVLERALHREDVTRIEEEEQTTELQLLNGTKRNI